MNNNITLRNGAQIAVIGGGPSGTLFSFFALKMAKMLDMHIGVTIFEPKIFQKSGPAGCNRCGGVISEHLVQTLAIEGINLPSNVIQRGINSYVLHTEKGDVSIESPAHEKRIATVYRGAGPLGIQQKDRESFDHYLLQCAIHEGAVHMPERISGLRNKKKPILSSGGRDVMEADLVVGAFGVNSTTYKIFEGLRTGYRKPETTSAFITELALGDDVVSRYFGNSIHLLLVPKPKNIKFAALIPKGEYVTLCILGKDIDKKTVEALLASQASRKVVPNNCLDDKFCKCFPKLSLRSAKGAFADRVVVIGDAGSTRLFKDGIGAAYMMGKAAAKTAVLHGVGRDDFAEHYYPVYKKTINDNWYGRIVYGITNTYKNNGLFTEALVNNVLREQKERSEKFPRLSSMLWDTFTGNAPYKDIFMRGTNIGMHFDLVWEFVKALKRKII